MPSRQDIQKLHRKLEASLNSSRLLATHVVIRQIDGEGWRNRRFRGVAVFDLWSPFTQEFGFSDRGRREPVASLSPHGGKRLELEPAQPGPGAWVSWFERWKRPGTGGFELLTAKWTVFWGGPGDDAKTQIARAEWNPSPAGESEGGGAGQPHWHVDRPLLVREQPVCTELEEIRPRPREARLSLKRVHLAMGGWRNSPPAVSRWQVDMGSDLSVLREWAVETLRYIRTECRFFRLEGPSASSPSA